MTLRACIYARYSSDLQSSASIEDQSRLCREKANSQDWEVVANYQDAAISGASLLRPGIQSLMQAAMNGEFDILICEALDRLSRDQEDIAGLFKRMEFAGVKIFTLSEGEISSLHIGLKGTMNAMFLKDLADKTRRGLRGRVEKGKSGGGLAYGYKVVKKFDANGEAIKGDREINHSQAEIIRRIFDEYARLNKSPKAIAAQLNLENISSPSGSSWGQSSINGNRRRGTGILNNHLYIGELIWNRQHFIKDPNTGKRVTRLNDEKDWVRADQPELRIVPQKLWVEAKARQKSLDTTIKGLHRNNRPQYLLSGLLKCGECGGGYSKVNASYYGCSASKNKGASVCDNRRTIKRETLENYVLSALQSRLMQEELVQIFCAQYLKHLNNLHKQQGQFQKRFETELAKLTKERENLVQAIKDGIAASMIKDDLNRVTTRISELKTLLEETPAQKPLIHPSMANRYYKAVENLRELLNQDGSRAQSSQHLRTLIDKITLTPKIDERGLTIDLHGDLAGILNVAMDNRDVKNPRILERLQLLPANDNKPKAFQAKTFQDSVGSGDRI